ncbi:MAG TPA: DUF1684 domain-containing protein, partial [Thermoanaerobaculia bacterium]|nr:DUF1684 domain-containing protein [Thermoanaerobaculia bacterium]
MRSWLLTPALFAITLAACQYEPGVGPAERVIAVDPAHRQEIEEWQARRTRSLTSETGWLTLTGLSWLQPGQNTIGSAEGSDIPLPASTAASVGTILLDGDSMTLRAAPEAGVTVNGEPVRNVVMKPDVSGEPTIAEIGSVQFYTIERGGKLGVRVRDRQHPARTTFEGLEYFPTNPEWRVEARLEPYDPPKQIPILNIIGIVAPQ